MNKLLTLFILLRFCTISFAQNLTTLIPTNTATHTAVQTGSWFDATTWNTGTVPSDASIVVIPMGKTVTYEGSSSAHIFAIRVDGTFICQQTNSNNTTTLTFDTFIGTHMSFVKFYAQNATDGDIDIIIKPFDIEAHEAGTSGFTQVWNADAISHYSDGATVEKVTREVGPDSRFNSYAEALAGNTTVTELTRTAYDDGVGVTGRYGWDTEQLSIGMIVMGQLEIIGQQKLAKSKLAADALNGQKDVTLEDIPTGWEVGDTIIITRGGNLNASNNGEDLVVIASINNKTITCVTNLKKKHEGRTVDNLHCYAGNLERNITFRSAVKTAIHQRGHFMAMHNNTNTQIKNASFKDMGRTDKSTILDDFVWDKWLEPKVFNCKISALGQEICEMVRNPDADITNSRGRYSIHLHKTGATASDNIIDVTGNSVWGNPGWAITQHDSYANISDNVVYDVVGAGIVSESGSELGFWDNNLVVQIAQGHTTSPYTSALFHDDYLYSGQGLAMKGRGVICRNNVIANANQGVGIINMNPSVTNHDRVDAQALATFRTGFLIDQFPLSQNGYSSEGDGVMPVEVALIMENTTIIGSYQGLRSIERDMGVNHESRSVFDGFIAWGITQGLSIVYQADYSFKDVFISGRNMTNSIGTFLWKHSHNHVFENIKMVDLAYGMMASKLVESGNGELKTRNNGFTPWYFIDLTTENITTFYQIIKENQSSATVYTEHTDNPIHLNSIDLASRPTTFTILDNIALEVDYSTSDFRFEVDGIVTDDLGSYNFGIKQAEAQGTLRLDYPSRIYEFASQAKFEEYLTANGVYKDEADNDQLYFILNEVLPNRRTYQYTSFPVRVKIMNAPSTGIFASPQVENAISLAAQNQIVSRNATVSQSSTKAGLTYDGEAIDASATKSIDGNNNGRVNCQLYQRGLVPLGSFSQTDSELEPWFDLDLGEKKTLNSIDIWNTVELNGVDIEIPSSHFGDFYVLVSDVPFGSSNLATARGLATYEHHEPNFVGTAKRRLGLSNLTAEGRYVRIQAVGTTHIKLAEVEIVGKTYVAILPVELIAFTAEPAENRIIQSSLKWITASETNVSHFEVEHSFSSQDFRKIGQIEAVGNSTELEDYDFTHEKPSIGKNYYRLKIVDFDGSFEYTPIRIVDFKSNNKPIKVYPNPSNGTFNIDLVNTNWAETIEVYNAVGQLIYTKSELSSSTVQLDLDEPGGIYTLVIRGKNEQQTIHKLIVL
jgi:hypothetical protein